MNLDNYRAMPDIIDLQEDTVKKCPFHTDNNNTPLKKIVYFGRKLHLDYDSDGNEIIDEYRCMSCGFRAYFDSASALAEMQQQVNDAAANKAELLDMKEKLRDSRRKKQR